MTTNLGSLTATNLRMLHSKIEPLLRNMRGGANAVMPGGTNVPLGMQLVETFVIIIVFSLTMQLLESNFQQLKRYQQMAVDIYPQTYNTPLVFPQDPSTCYPILEPSKDERNGIEYSYSCFIRVGSENFTGQKNALRHIYHKGSPTIYPLMAPGVFFKADTNTIRIYQNSTIHWDRHVDIPNIPLNKWFHLVVMIKGNALDVYINGNLANRMKFDSVPKLNYSGFYLLSNSTVGGSLMNATCSINANIDDNGQIIDETITAGVTQNPNLQDRGTQLGKSSMRVIGAMKGYVSRVKYFAFALTYTQIDKLLREGPNPKIYVPKQSLADTNLFETLPFYQTDDWWSSDVHSGLGPQ